MQNIPSAWKLSFGRTNSHHQLLRTSFLISSPSYLIVHPLICLLMLWWPAVLKFFIVIMVLNFVKWFSDLPQTSQPQFFSSLCCQTFALSLLNDLFFAFPETQQSTLIEGKLNFYTWANQPCNRLAVRLLPIGCKSIADLQVSVYFLFLVYFS